MSGPWEKYQQGPWAKYQAQADPVAGSPSNPRRYTNPTRDKSSGELAWQGAKNFAGDIGLGAQQVMDSALAALGNPAAKENLAVLESRANIRKLDPTLKTTAGKAGYMGAALVPAVAASFIPGANTVVGQGVVGAGMGLLQPTGTGDSRMMNTALSGGAGMAGQGVANAIGRIAQPITKALSGAEDDAVRLLKNEGISLRPGQQTGSRATKTVERVLFDNPVSAPTMERASQEQARQFTRAALRRIGVDADNAGPEVMTAARTRITGALDDIEARYAPNVQSIAPDLATLKGEAALLEQYGRPIVGIIDDLERQAQAGTLNGTLVAKYRTTLGRLSHDPYVGGMAGDLDEVLANGMHQAMQGTDDFARYAEARTMYRDMKAIESAVQNVENPQVAAGTLASRMANGRFTKDAFKYGTGDQSLPKLARAGSSVIDRTPNSGTPQRIAALALPSALGGLWGYGQEGDPAKAAQYAAYGLLAPAVASRLVTSPWAANYLAQGMGGMTGGLLRMPSRLPIGSLASAGLLTAQ